MIAGAQAISFDLFVVPRLARFTAEPAFANSATNADGNRSCNEPLRRRCGEVRAYGYDAATIERYIELTDARSMLGVVRFLRPRSFSISRRKAEAYQSAARNLSRLKGNQWAIRRFPRMMWSFYG